MPTVEFKPRVHYANPTELDRKKYPNVKVPPGVSPRLPTLVSATRMQELAPSKTISVVAGLTKADFSLRFADLKKQWKQVRSRASQTLWQFQGGDVFLEVKITLYVAEGFEKQKEAFETILDHELLHVADEISIVESYLPEKMRNDTYVKSHLLQGTAMPDKTFEHWYVKHHFEDWIEQGLWAPRHNELAAARDSGREWESYRQKIDALQRR